ncbi:PAS domain S-box protein [Telmatocola sphagniphila]|uniref:histidine kinase n=1 Tax=Telmatocola sphagniphila TaxID=1123043 RepID=A0A8E6B168_9BACT|nr:PAS domain S-box protein [Telmatocola sphagniphila]QVL29848.1 PAS domain S-box protein [Telmatocola sphagniphila]
MYSIAAEVQPPTIIRSNIWGRLFDCVSEGIEIYDLATGKLVDVNRPICDMHGYSKLEYLSSPPQTPLAFEHTTLGFEMMAARLREGESFFQEFERRRKDGSSFPAEIRAELFQSDREYLIFLISDISQRRQIESSLRESELKIRTILDSEPECVKCLDENGIVLQINPAGVAMIEADSAKQVLNLCVFPLIVPEDRERYREMLRRGFSGESVTLEYETNSLRGNRLIFETHCSPLRDSSNKIISLVSITRDITARKKAEKALFASEELFRTFMNYIPMAAWITDTQGRVVFVSEGCRKLFQVSDGDLIGNGFAKQFPEVSTCFNSQNLPHTDLGNRPFKSLHTGIRADGSKGEFLVYKFPIRTDRELVGGVAIDLTDQIKMQEELISLGRAVSASTQGILITDNTLPENPITYVSPAFERLTGFSLQEALGRNCRFLQGKDTDPASVAVMRQTIKSQTSCNIEILNYRKDGTAFWNAVFISPIRDEAGRVTNFIGVQTDITERRKLEEQLRQALKMEAIGRLAGGVAHDFNNLLTVINGYSDLLIEKLRPEDPMRDLLAEIHKAGERAGGLTRQLLAFSRQQVLEPKILNLNDVLFESEKLLRRLIGEDVILDIIKDPSLGCTKLDPVQIEQIIINLSVNAQDAMPRGGLLTIRTSSENVLENNAPGTSSIPPGDYICLSVQDTGMGIDDDTLTRIFEPFFTTKGLGKGTGLGLSTVHGIASQSGGYITVSTAVGKGTTFKIYFPKVESSGWNRKSIISNGKLPRGTETILLVEDEDAVRILAKHILRTCGYTVLDAPNGNVALEIARTHLGNIDLLISDVVMPYLGGRELAEKILSIRPDCLVLFLSGYTDDALLRHGVREAEFAFLQKPFSPPLLAHKVRATLDEKTPSLEEVSI